jgi:hypothetical protein
MSHGDSEFEQVGWSDLESLDGGGYAGRAKEDEEERTHVEVELPPHLLSEGRAAVKTDQSSIRSELHAHKMDLKQQLKQYDMNFARKHGRMPVKAEKEPIRHLYEGYNTLKTQIGLAEQGQLHQMLRSYEKDFYKENKRQVSSFADIKPVASQYRRYKEIKKASAALQQSEK